MDEIPNTRFCRLKQRTLPCSFQVAYLPAKTNYAADALGTYASEISEEDCAEVALVTMVTREAEEVTSTSWSMIANEIYSDHVL